MIKICGFKVVNQVELGNYHGDSGPPRDAWVVLDNARFSNKLPNELIEIVNEYDSFHKQFGYHGPFAIVTSIDMAKKASNYCRSEGFSTEIIGLYSLEWENLVGSFFCEDELEFLGFDPVSNWSILDATIFGIKRFLDWKQRLNKFGLFDDRADALCFSEFYLKNMEPNGPLEEIGCEISILEVYRLVEP